MTSASKTPTNKTPHEPPPADALARQLHVFKWLAALLAAGLAVGAGAFFYVRHLGQPVTILVNGKPAATVRNVAAANALVAAAEKAKVGAAFADETPIRLQKVSFIPAAPDAAQETDVAAQAKLARLLTLRVPAFVILVDGQPSLAFPTPDAATQTLQQVKDHWAKMPPAAPIVGQEQIMQSAAIEKRTVDTSLLRADPDTAAPYYWTPPPSKTYTVHSGDLGSRIARRNHLSLADFMRANPSKNLNRLKPGDVVNVQKLPLLLSVRVRKSVEVTEKVHPSAPAAVAGLQQVTYVITYLNGTEQGREARSVVILQKPQTAVSL